MRIPGTTFSDVDEGRSMFDNVQVVKLLRVRELAQAFKQAEEAWFKEYERLQKDSPGETPSSEMTNAWDAAKKNLFAALD